MIKKTKFYSKKIGKLAKGCQLCVQGKKLVLFVTGLCSKHCFFCPISEQKWQSDVVYANERPVVLRNVKEIIEEAKLCDAEGAGITGGDPLIKVNRTIEYIKAMKKKFGNDFHIHLYTPLDLVTKNKLKNLYKAGLDEIRFHPDFASKKLWKRIFLAKEFAWQVGIEIPVIPKMEKRTKELLDFIDGKVDFLNLNELEISDTNAQNLVKAGYRTKDNISYAVKGSEQLAVKLLKYCKKLNVHYCTTTLKDKVQLAKRIRRRAKNVSKKYDYVTKEGILVRGAVYGDKLTELKEYLMKEHAVPEELIEVEKKRLLTSVDVVDKLKKELKEFGKPAIVEEYPTFDRMIVELEWL